MKLQRSTLILAALLGLSIAVATLSGCDGEAVAESGPLPVAQGPTEAISPTVAGPEHEASENGAVPSSFAGNAGAPGDVQAATTSAGGPTNGAGAVDGNTLAIETVLASPASYVGKEVTVRGVILTQCIRGCRFSIDDGTGVIGIELVDEALEKLIAQGSVGRTVRVTGSVEGSSRPLIFVHTADGWTFDD